MKKAGQVLHMEKSLFCGPDSNIMISFCFNLFVFILAAYSNLSLAVARLLKLCAQKETVDPEKLICHYKPCKAQLNNYQ